MVVDKNHIVEKLFVEKNVFYNFVAGILIKSILEKCNEDIHIIIDNHTTKVTSANSLSDYIKALAFGEWGFRNTIRIDFMDSKAVKGLQAVDLIANPIWSKYNYNKPHLYELSTNHYRSKLLFPFTKFGS
ncbi:MAG: DUF3800 domain-containing protein [Candidatus Dojkabacteria bacterium]